MPNLTLFERIMAREIPANIIYEDEKCVAFRDIAPVAPTHILIVPRKPIPSLMHIEAEDTLLIGHLFAVSKQLAIQENIHESGFRTLFNCGEDAGQTVFHLHLHLIGAEKLGKMG